MDLTDQVRRLPYFCIVQDKEGNLFTAAKEIYLHEPILGQQVTIEYADENGMLHEVTGCLYEYDCPLSIRMSMDDLNAFGLYGGDKHV